MDLIKLKAQKQEIKIVQRPGTRKEKEVWQACDLLWQEGLSLKELTGELIGDKLLDLGYSRGSNSDLHRYKRSWVVNRPIRL